MLLRVSWLVELCKKSSPVMHPLYYSLKMHAIDWRGRVVNWVEQVLACPGQDFVWFDLCNIYRLHKVMVLASEVCYFLGTVCTSETCFFPCKSSWPLFLQIGQPTLYLIWFYFFQEKALAGLSGFELQTSCRIIICFTITVQWHSPLSLTGFNKCTDYESPY